MDMVIDNRRFRLLYRLCGGKRLRFSDVGTLSAPVGPVWTGALPVIGWASSDGIGLPWLRIRRDGEGLGIEHTTLLCDLSLRKGSEVDYEVGRNCEAAVV